MYGSHGARLDCMLPEVKVTAGLEYYLHSIIVKTVTPPLTGIAYFAEV